MTHAVVGACTGNVFGRPFVGAMVAVLPDLVLGVKRRKFPNKAYKITHSWIGLLVCAFAPGYIFWPYLSHILLDIPTHGKDWAPRLFYPSSICIPASEWEFFNISWWIGLILAFLWVVVCLIL